MSRIVTLVGLVAMLVTVAACSKPANGPGAPAGPALNPPTEKPLETPPPSEAPPETPAATEGTTTPPPVEETAPAETPPAGEETQGAVIGTPGAAWANLEGTDGQMHSLNDLADAEVVVVVFTCNKCPVAQDYEERLVSFVDDYRDNGVTLVAINVNNHELDKLPAMRERAEEKGFNFAYLYDPSQESARAYGAAVTPHAFVLDQSRNVVYMGAIDDNQDEAAVAQHSLRDAVDAVLASRTPEVAETEPHGCAIAYE